MKIKFLPFSILNYTLNVFFKKLLLGPFTILGLIFILGLFLRTYRLSEIPVGFHIDEAQVGYNAFSLLKTARDEIGSFLPTHLKIWSFERPLGVAYLSIPGVAIFGLSEFGTRIDIAIIGAVSILLVFLLTESFFGNKNFSLLSTFLFAISPWHIGLSRATSDAVLALFFCILGVLLTWKAYKKQSLFSLFLAYGFYVLSFFSYYSTRLVIPVILLIFFIAAVREKKRLAFAFLTFFLVYLVFPFWIFWGTSSSRFNQVSVFHEQGTRLNLEEQIREDGGHFPIVLTRVFHNKIINFSLKIIENFSSYFTADFLILKGGLPIRYLVPNFGVVYFWELPFLLWGVILLFTNNKKIKNNFVIVLWVILGALSASLTIEETPNVQRALFVLPAFQWLVALGLLDIFQRASGKIKFAVIFIFILANVWNISYFVHQYTVHAFLHRPWYRFYEMKELVVYLNSAKKQYKNIYLTFNSTEPYIYFLFYNQISPQDYQKLIKERGLDFVWNNIDNIKIVRRDCPIISPQNREETLAIFKVSCRFPKGSRLVKKFAFPDGAVSLIAVDFPKGFSKVYENLLYEENETIKSTE